MRTLRIVAIGLGLAALAGAPARADLKLCNRMSYVVEAAIGIENKGAIATRGWFRTDPGQCREVIQGELQYEHIYLHARALPAYGASPLPQSGQVDLCVASGNFVIAGARNCRAGQRPARFAEIKPSDSGGVLTAYLAEEAEYDDTQARDAGIQRLLGVAGYDAGPIDGVRGSKTDAALMQFLQEHKLPATSAARSDFFDTLLDAAQKVGSAFSWCNDTGLTVMAALGAEEGGTIVTRGWYRVEPGKCLRPELRGPLRQVYSFGEAVDLNGQPITTGGRSWAWGGETTLCTREAKFELTEHRDCAANGLTATGFATVALSGGSPAIVRFRAP